MSIQHQRVVELCNDLRLGGVAAQYTVLAQQAAEKQSSFTDFVEELLIYLQLQNDLFLIMFIGKKKLANSSSE